jgi:predicted HAD superfamily Cof-like phosphohydrolase
VWSVDVGVDPEAARHKAMPNQALVRQFHRLFGYDVNDGPTKRTMQEQDFRYSLIREEYMELRAELQHVYPDVAAVAHEAADLMYVLYGLACELGFDLDACFREVHRANMSKDRAAEGKAIKGDRFVPANIEGVING